ncbi:unnamed protein product [Notodromas monacha]|uniref:Uncharacterized protein n=1 Tax=Notodromas monacha TaxID=399045 RepID=A0A7R9GB25_9CRUS|nr:unnamed protein product [Notodromas monacha]CAG0914631.1 unnamed protein product [Notodromas monacha]
MSTPCATRERSIQNDFIYKWLSLVALTIQQVLATSLLRHAQSRHENEDDLFHSSAGVATVEVQKTLAALLLLRFSEHASFEETFDVLKEMTSEDFDSLLTVALVAGAYLLHNYFLWIAGKYLSTAAYLVISQTKTLSAAFFATALAGRIITVTQWIALFVLVIGVALLQTSVHQQQADEMKRADDVWLGLVYLLGASTLSGYAGTAFEIILKSPTSNVSVWARSVQLSAVSAVMSIALVAFQEYDSVARRGFFHGYDAVVWTTVTAQASGGLLVALSLKYADNVAKSFSTAVAILLSIVTDALVFHTSLPFHAQIESLWNQLSSESVEETTLQVLTAKKPLQNRTLRMWTNPPAQGEYTVPAGEYALPATPSKAAPHA